MLREGGVGVVVGPVRPAGRIARALADLWMLFPPSRSSTAAWFERGRLRGRRGCTPVAPDWYRDTRVPTPSRSAGTKPARRAVAAGARAARRATAPRRSAPPGGVRSAARFAAGSLAGLAFVPIALAMTLRARRERR